MTLRPLLGRSSFAAAFVISSVVVAGQPASQTATEYYLAFRAAFDKAKRMEDILPYMAKETRAKIEKEPASERPSLFELYKEINGGFSQVKILGETKTANGANLALEAISTAG